MTGDSWGASEPERAGALPAEVSAAQLAELAITRPDLWDEIWHHPNCYDGLRQWMAERYEQQQTAAGIAAASPFNATATDPGATSDGASRSPIFAIVASIAAAALVLAGTGTALALSGTFDKWFGGSSSENAAVPAADLEQRASFTDGGELRWTVDGDALGIGKAQLGYMERMMPPAGVISPGWADVVQFDGGVVVHAETNSDQAVVALLAPGSGDVVWQEDASASGPASCSASLDLARAFCLLPGGASGSVVVLDAKGEVGRFDVPGEMKDLRADGEGLVLFDWEQGHERIYSQSGELLQERARPAAFSVDGHSLVSGPEQWQLYDEQQNVVGQGTFSEGNRVEAVCKAVLAGKKILLLGPSCAGPGEAAGFTIERFANSTGYANYVPGERPIWLLPSEDGLLAFDQQGGEQLWQVEGTLPGWYQPAQVSRANGAKDPATGLVLVEQAAGYALVDLVSGDVTPIDAQARGTSVAVSGDSVLIFYGSQDPGAPATVDTFDALSGEVTGRFELPGTVEIGEATGGPQGVMLASSYCSGCSTAEGASSIGGYSFVGPSSSASGSGVLALAERVAAQAPDFVPACPGETVLLAWMELEDGWIVVCGVDVNTPSYVAYQPGGEGKPRFSLGATKPTSKQARSSVQWDAATSRYLATMADGSKLTLDYLLGMATMRDSDTSSTVSEQQRFVRYVFVPMGEGVRAAEEIANETGAFDVKAPKATAEDQIRYMIEVLEKAYAGRAMLKDALPKLAGCTAGPGGYADTVAAMQAVRDNRAELLAALDAMPVDKIPEGKQLLADLTEAIELSHQANVEYVAWAEAANASGCATLSAAGKTAADASDAPKERFASRWNSVIAPKYGVRSFDGWFI